MKNKEVEKSEPPPEEVELVVTQEDYEEGLKRGWTDDEMLKPGRYKLRRGGFLARHPEFKVRRESAPDDKAQVPGSRDGEHSETEAALDGRAS